VINNALAADFKNESLNYVITYKWGLIRKDAGDARLTLTNSGNNYNVMLTAKTKPWADKFYAVRDTLRCTIRKSGFRPLEYVKIAHEKGTFSKDVITYTYSGNKTSAHAKRLKVKNGKTKHLTKNFTSTRQAFDMLSIFYFLRTIDYRNITNGTIIKKTIFSGSKAETITIKYLGLQTITLHNKRKASAYHIQFRFSTDGGKKSSDDMNTWISTDSRHIPLLLIGNLPVGEVKCYYIG